MLSNSATAATRACCTRNNGWTTRTTLTRWHARAAELRTLTSWSLCRTASLSARSRSTSSGHNSRRCRVSPPAPRPRVAPRSRCSTGPARLLRRVAPHPPHPRCAPSSTPAWPGPRTLPPRRPRVSLTSSRCSDSARIRSLYASARPWPSGTICCPPAILSALCRPAAVRMWLPDAPSLKSPLSSSSLTTSSTTWTRSRKERLATDVHTTTSLLN